LFPRLVEPLRHSERSRADQDSVARDRAEAMRRHPAGKNLPSGCRHRVQVGDTLWDISSGAVGRPDPQVIDRFVDQLYEANKQTISDPDVIYPGQVIRIPGCEK